MGLALLTYAVLATTGTVLFWGRTQGNQRPPWLWPVHAVAGGSLISLVMVLLTIGIVGTLGEYGHLGHSWHLVGGSSVALLVMASGWSALQIRRGLPWARRLHITLNVGLALALAGAGLTGWQVVQKYLP